MQVTARMKTGTKLLIEVTIWVLTYLLLLFLFRTQRPEIQQLIAIECILWLYFVTFINSTVFIPKFLINGKRIVYLLLTFLVLILSFVIARRFLLTEQNGYLYHHIKSPDPSLSSRRGIHMTVFQLLTIAFFLGSTVIQVYKKNKQTQEEMMQVALEKKDAELKLLRTQFNPHFLLNALNNLYSVVIIRPDHSKKHIERLISLMKYLTYDQTDNAIPLSKELNFIDDYIFFQVEKEKQRFEVQKNFDIKDTESGIEPRVLIPFVENAFKHSYHPEKMSRIEINCIQQTNDLAFSIINSKSNFTHGKKEQGYFGVGVDSTQQILQSVYGNMCQITFGNDDKTYSVEIIFKNFFQHA